MTRVAIRVEGRSATDPTLQPVNLNATIEAPINDLIDAGDILKKLKIFSQ